MSKSGNKSVGIPGIGKHPDRDADGDDTAGALAIRETRAMSVLEAAFSDSPDVEASSFRALTQAGDSVIGLWSGWGADREFSDEAGGATHLVPTVNLRSPLSRGVLLSVLCPANMAGQIKGLSPASDDLILLRRDGETARGGGKRGKVGVYTVRLLRVGSPTYAETLAKLSAAE